MPTTAVSWEPAREHEGRTVRILSLEAFKDAMEAVFGPFPVRLDANDVRVLNAMQAASDSPDYGGVVANLVEVHGAIYLNLHDRE